MVQFRKDFDIIPQILSHKLLTCQTSLKLRSEALQGFKSRTSLDNLSHRFGMAFLSCFVLIGFTSKKFQATHFFLLINKFNFNNLACDDDDVVAALSV